jgi:hypothetical protein
VIELDDDKFEAIRLLVDYFYNTDYPATNTGMASFGGVLLLHANMYIVADKYEVLDLKEMAVERFGKAVPAAVKNESVAPVIELVFANTASAQDSMREFLVDVWPILSSFLRELGNDGAVHDLFAKVPEFTAAIALRFTKLGPTIGEQFALRCDRCSTASAPNAEHVFLGYCRVCRENLMSEVLKIVQVLKMKRFW